MKVHHRNHKSTSLFHFLSHPKPTYSQKWQWARHVLTWDTVAHICCRCDVTRRGLLFCKCEFSEHVSSWCTILPFLNPRICFLDIAPFGSPPNLVGTRSLTSRVWGPVTRIQRSVAIGHGKRLFPLLRFRFLFSSLSFLCYPSEAEARLNII
jgi:hypothetical protein